MGQVTGLVSTGSSKVEVPRRDDVYRRAVEKCRTVTVKLGGVLNENYRSKGKTLLSTSGSLTLTAANGLNFLYVGYF